jgi:hypothetical protein
LTVLIQLLKNKNVINGGVKGKSVNLKGMYAMCGGVAQVHNRTGMGIQP